MGLGYRGWTNRGSNKPKPKTSIRYPSRGQGVVGAGASPALARFNNYLTNAGPAAPRTWESMVGYQQGELGNVFANNAAALGPAGGSSGGGGGYGRGGGGGGGGGAAITQAMIDAMAKALQAQPPQMNLPAFRGQALPAFNAQPYTQALNQINSAVAADQANINANQQATTTQLQNSYSNPYATAQVAQGPATQQIGAGLAGTVGGTVDPAAAQQANAANAGDQASFQNLLTVLAGADQASQNSRMAQVGMDANYGRQQLSAQALGMRGGVQSARAQASNAWRTQQAERNYQNDLMRQQWAREQGQTNYQAQAAAQQARLQPILDLIANSAGASGLNFAALFQALGVK